MRSTNTLRLKALFLFEKINLIQRLKERLRRNRIHPVSPNYSYSSNQVQNISTINQNLSQMQMFNITTSTPKNVKSFRQRLSTLMLMLIVLLTSTISFSQTTFNTSGTYTVPPGVTAIKVNAWGGGGGGGGGFNSCTAQGEGSGGGGGGYAASTFAVVPGQVYTITVGAGGTGAAYNGNGTAGGITTVSGPQSIIIATGGGAGLGGGACGNVAGGVGGIGTSGAIFFSGGAGSNGIHTATTATGVSGKGGGGAGSGGNGTTPNTACPGTTGTGGIGTFAGGNGGVTGSCGVGVDAAGQPGAVRGGGGSGGQGWTSAVTGVGGTGGSGQVVIEELTPAVACTSPTLAPTSLVLTAPLSNRINISYTAAAGADGYLIVRYPTGSSPTAPSDGTLYIGGSSLGLGTVVGYGGIAFANLGLNPATTYDFYVYSANTICTGGPLYFGTPLTGTVSTPALPASTAFGGLWSSPATWVTGVVPAGLEDVTIATGATVTVDQVVTVPNLTVNGILQWNGTANAMTVTGNVTINPGGKFLAYTTALASVTLNVAGNFTNNGYANFAPSVINFNGAGSTLNGTGSFQGNGSSGIIRLLAFQNLGSNSVSTSQNLATTFGVTLSAGSLNTGGKIIIDNTAQVYGQPLNLQVANIAVTTMGAGYSTNPPVVFGVTLTKWAATTTLVLNTRYFAGTNVYLCTTGGLSGGSAPTTQGNTPFADGAAQLLYLGQLGTLGLPYQTTANNAVGTQYQFQGTLYTALNAVAPTVAGAASLGTTVGTIYTAGTAQMLCVGTAATVSVNFDATTQSVRSLTLTSPGSGYSTAPALAFINTGTTPSPAAAATAVYFQQVTGQASSIMQKTQGTGITGGLTINSDQGTSLATAHAQASSGVGAISTSNGGVNYSVVPTVGFAGPTALNLVSNPGTIGSYATAPTITVDATNLVTGTNLTTSNFTITMNQGQIVSVYLNATTTATYSAPPTLTLSSALGGASLAWPAGCWPSATPVIGSNGQLTNFTINSPGYGYVVAPTAGIGTTSGGVLGGTFTTVATAPTTRIALYNLTLSFFLPATSVTTNTDDASIPTSRKLNNLTLGSSGGAGLALSGNITLFGTNAVTAPLVITGSTVAPFNIIDLGGNNLNFTWNGYGGTTGAFGASNTYIRNGSMSLTGRGGASTFNFPFSATFTWFAGSTPTTVTTGSTVTRVTVTETGAPSGTAAIGTRAWLVNNNGGIQGLNPTVTMNYNTVDALPSGGNATDLYISQATALSGSWTPRSLSSGAGTVGTSGVRTTASVAPGPYAPTGNDYLAWTTVTFNYANVSSGAVACTAVPHLISADITSSLGTIAAANITYNNSGSATGPVAMTNTSGNTWQFTIPAATPSNRVVTWSITVTTSTGLTNTFTGTSYQDDALNGSTVTASAVPNPVCSGNPVTLTAAASLNGVAKTIGAGATTSATAGLSCFSGAWGGHKTQYIIRASELTAAGFVAGNLTSLAFETTNATAGSTYQGFNVHLGNTANTTAAFPLISTGLTQVFRGTQTDDGYTPVNTSASNINTLTFGTGTGSASGFAWDGISNLVVQFCWSKVPIASSTTGTTMKVDVTAFTCTASGQKDVTLPAAFCPLVNSADFGTTTTGTSRPKFTFVGTVLPTGITTYTWNDGTSDVGTGNPLIQNPTTTTTYSVTASTGAGCTIVSPPITVTVLPLPPAPGANNSVQCGTGVPTAFVTTGGGGAGFKWYSAQTGGTLLQTGGATYTSSISSTTHFWVSESDGSCESLRTEVIASVNAPDAVQASVDFNNPCSNTTIQLTATTTGSTNGNVYVFTWTASPASGSGIPTSQAGGTGTFGTPASTSVTPTAAGTYTYTVSGVDATLGCATTSTVVVTVKALPVINSAAATPSTICAGTNVTLNGNTIIVTPGVVTVGTSTTTIQGGSPFRAGGASDTKTQLLYLASELSAAGIAAGNISSITFTFSAGSGGTLPNFTVKMGHTAVTALTSAFTAGATNVVFGPTVLVPLTTTGDQTITFTTSFNWNGTSNLLIDLCHDIPTGAAGSGFVNANTTAFVSNSQILIGGACAATTGGTTQSLRPIIKFGAQQFAVGAGSLNWSWNPGSLSGPTQIVTPGTTTTYTVTASDPATTCSNTATVTVTVNPLPPAPSGADGTDQCGTGLTDASVSSNNVTDPQVPPFFKWYLVPTGGTASQTGTSTTYNTPISATTNFYVSEVSLNGCEGPRVQFTTVVSSPDPVTATSSTGAQACLGESFDISSSYTPDFNNFATFDLTATGGAASGVTGTVSLTATPTGSVPYLVTPTTAGTYTYTVTAFDPDKGCTSVGTVVVNVNPVPTGVTAGASSLNACTGSTVNLTSTGSSNIFAGGPTTLFSQSFATVSPLPVGWAQQNLSNPIGTTGWNQGDGTVFAANSGPTNEYVFANFNSTDQVSAGHISNWLFTPTVTMHNGDVFTFYTRTEVGSTFPDRLEVRLSTNGSSTNVGATSTSVGDFTTVLLSINPTLAVGGYPESWTQFTATITGLVGAPSGRVAFRYNVTNGGFSGANSDYIGIDDVVYTGQVESPVTFAWTSTPAGFTSAQQNPTNVAITQTTTYTVTVSNTPGCSTTASVTVTALPLPAAPSTNSPVSRCGPGSVTLTATGSGGPLKWYNVATGGTSLFTGGSFTTTVLLGNTSFWVAEVSESNCEGPRTEVQVTATTPPTLSITAASSTTFCLGGSVALDKAPGSDASYTNFTWSSIPAGAGLSSTSGPAITATPTVAGTYTITLTADDGVSGPTGCANTATIVLTVNPNPSTPVPTATPNTICDGGVSQLDAGTALPGLLTTPVAGGNGNAGNVFDITAANTITVTSVAMGISAGTFAEVWYKPGGYGCTSSLTSNAGWTLLTPSGGSAITPAGGSPNLTNIPLTSTIMIPAGQTYGFVVVCNSTNYYTDGSVVCTPWASDGNISIGQGLGGSAVLGGGTWTFTNVVRNFNGRVGYVVSDPSLNYTWAPPTGLSSTVIINPSASPSTTTTYTVTATNAFGCSKTGSVTVTVQPVGANATATPSTPICVGTSVTLNAGATGGSPFTYAWASTPAGTYDPTASINVTPAVTTTYTVTVTDVCGNPTTSSVTVTVNPLPTASIQETGPITLCSPATQLLTAVTDAGSATYQWTLNGNNISGATASTYTVSGIGSGAYRVIVTNTVTNCASAASAPVTVTINYTPTNVVAGSSTNVTCNGTPIDLTSSADSPPTSILTQTWSAGLNGWTAVNNSAGPNPAVTAWTIQPSPFTSTNGTPVTFNSGAGNFILSNADLGGSGTTVNTTLTSPAFSTINYSALNLSLRQYFRFFIAGVNVQVSTNGTTWTTVKTYSTDQGAPASFATDNINLNAYINFPSVQVRFSYVDGWAWYWAIDDIAITGTPSAYTYSWTSNPAGFTSILQNPTGVAPSVTTTYSVTISTVAGCSASASKTVTVNPRPTAAISGTGAFCQNAANTSTNLTVNFTGTAPWNYTYTVDGGSPVSGTTSSNPLTIAVAPSSASPHVFTYEISALSDANCASIAADLSGSGTVTINPLAASPTAVVSVQPTCAVGTGTVTVTAPLGTGNSYTLDGTTTINWPTVSFTGVTPGPHTITVANSFGCSAPASTSVTVDPQPFIPGTPVVTGIVNVCPYIGVAGVAGQVTYHATATGNGTQVFNWVIPTTNVTIVSGQGTADLVLTFQNGFAAQANKQLRLTVTNQCGTSSMTIYYLLAQFPNTPNPITGPTNVCTLIGTATTATYTTNKAAGALFYNWTVPANATIVGHPGGAGTANDTSIVVTFQAGFAGGNVTVVAENVCGPSGARTLTIVNAVPSTPGLISGPTNACPATAPTGVAATYSIVPVPFATSYTWTTPVGTVVTHPNGAGPNDYTITVLYPVGFTSGSITVKATNGCGTGGVRSLSITKLNPATPSVIDVVQTRFCGDPLGRAYTYALASMPANATAVVWTIPAGATSVNITPIKIEVTYPITAVNGFVTAQGTNASCVSTIRSSEVKLPACPPEGFAAGKGETLTAPLTKAMEVRIFPNPTVSDFKLQVLTSGSEEITVRVLDNLGRLYKSFKMMPYQTIALGAELKAGSYMVEVRQGAEVKTSKVIKF